jgi:hypothetical protein
VLVAFIALRLDKYARERLGATISGYQGCPKRLAITRGSFGGRSLAFPPYELLDHLGTNVFIFHGYAELWIADRWVKATPCFNLSLCERFGVMPLEFDGVSDAMLHPYDTPRAIGRRLCCRGHYSSSDMMRWQDASCLDDERTCRVRNNLEQMLTAACGPSRPKRPRRGKELCGVINLDDCLYHCQRSWGEWAVCTLHDTKAAHQEGIFRINDADGLRYEWAERQLGNQ